VSERIIGLDDGARMLADASDVMITCHLGPDGDAIGSMSALAAILEAQGKKVTLFNPDGAPAHLRFLPRATDILRALPARAPWDLAIAVDCGARSLLGPAFPGEDVTGPLLVLDHHATSKPFGAYLCLVDAASVAVVVARLAARLGWEIPAGAAPGIYTSIVSDTGSFRYSNTNPESFQLAARCLELGVDPWEVARVLGEETPLARYKLLGAALAAIELEAGGKVAVIVLTDDMVKAAGARWDLSEGLVNYARGIEGVEVGVQISPLPKGGGSRVSLRSKGRVDAGAVAARFGGGGHRGAAGCHIAGTLADARTQLVAALSDALGR
jgi:phosphoesterase RecJ-like protein